MNQNIRYYHSWKEKYGDDRYTNEPARSANGVLINLYPQESSDSRLVFPNRKSPWLTWLRTIIHVIACLVILATVLFGISMRA